MKKPPPPHGTRSRYQAGCRCLLCRAAEAEYRAFLRRRKLRGQPILGRLVSPHEARRRIRQLKLEDYTTQQIAHMAGWRNGRLQFLPRAHIRLSTFLRIARVAAYAMLEGADPL